MVKYPKEIMSLLATDTFIKLLGSSNIKVVELNAAIALLIKANLDFDLLFTSGTRRSNPQAILTIHINSSTNVDFNITLE